MESEKETPSVIARLMGFDELPPQHTRHKQRKVLSEGYFRKVASIGQCENSRFYSRCSSKIISNQKRSKDKDDTEENFGFDNLHKLIIYKMGLKPKTRISRNNFFLTGDKKKSNVFRDKSVKENEEITQKELSRRVSRREFTFEAKPKRVIRFERKKINKMFKEDDIDGTRCIFREIHIEKNSKDFGKLNFNHSSSEFEKSSNHFQLEGFGFSNSKKIVPEFVKDLRVNNQSPNSVLDPFLQEESIYLDDFHSMGMAISSDEETEKEPFYFSQDTCDVKESRNFSYLIDVLDEAGFTSTSQDISPLVFLKLEKKYGKQIYWSRSERRYLFDQINEGLKEILSTEIKEKSLRKRMSYSLRRDEIEEELWTVVIRDEKRGNCKGFGTEIKWFRLGEEVYDVCKEIEDYLFDILVGELVDV